MAASVPVMAAFASVVVAFAIASKRALSKPVWNLIGRPWGAVDGKIVTLFTLSNSHLTVDISNYGGIISRLLVKGRDGTPEDVVLGYNKLEDFVKGKCYFGAICGRSANRIANGRFAIDGKEFKVTANAAPHHLHGGATGFDRKVWEVVSATVGDNGPELCLKYISPEGEEGYPGTLEVRATFTLIEDRIAIEFSAVCDEDTVVNLTHHAYFNLSGHSSGSIEHHRLRINAEAYTPVDDSLIPTGEIRQVEGTPFDFRRRREIGADLRSIGTGEPKGYDHNFVLTNRFGTLCEAAEVTDPRSLRRLIVETDAPGLQLYTSNFITAEPGKDGAVYGQYQALCLEAQSFPDAVNKRHFPSAVLRQGQPYSRRIHFVFPRASSW